MSVQLVFFFIILPWLILLPAASLKSGGSGCNETCGDVVIPSPFGIGECCYPNPWFKVICIDGKKPVIKSIHLELLGLYSTEAVIVNSPVRHVNCGDKKDGRNGTIAVADDNLIRSPFLLSLTANALGVIGCGNLVTIVNEENTVIGGCLQPRCEDATSKGCYIITRKTENLISVSATITKFYSGKAESGRCGSIFMLGSQSLDDEPAFFPDIGNRSTQVPAVLEWNKPVDCQLEVAQCRQLGVPLNELKCTKKCGNVDISYPFGIEDECYKDDWYKVICKEINGSETPFIHKLDLPMLSVSFSSGIVRINHSVTYSNCHQKDTNGNGNGNGSSVNLKGPFFFSNIYNRFASVGCGNLATIFHNQADLISSCVQQSCGNDVTSNSVSCILPIPPGINWFNVNMTSDYPGNDGIGINNSSCGSTFMFSSEDISLDMSTLTTAAYLPVELEFAKPIVGECEFKEDSKISCTSDGKYCWTNLSPTYLCVCSNAANSISYSSDMCGETRKCKYPKFNYCHMLCWNEPGKNCLVECPEGYEKIDKICKLNNPTSSDDKTRHWAIIISCSTSVGTILVLLVGWRLYKILKRRKNKKLRQKNFKRNGGLLLQQQLSTAEGNVDKTRLYTSKELEKATDYYNRNRVLGEGGQGTVYKGMLVDGSIVAIKKSKMVREKKKSSDEMELEQFINEVIILSQINHRNVVRLLGCCLETELPLLVYEFVPNGTLSKLIEEQNDEFPLTWEMRLRIATEVGNALSYLHSAASVPIYHRDIKSSNILLDDKYRAKVSDFGISKSIALEQTHLTTRVQGTFGYMDPEYFRSSQFTEKSDVYSFGVVLLELLTGQKPFYSKKSEESRSLVPFFLLAMKENSLFDILDPRMVNNGPEEEIIAVAKLARRCLNLNGKRRPTMKQVAMELELIRNSEEKANSIQQSDDEDSDTDDMVVEEQGQLTTIVTLP